MVGPHAQSARYLAQACRISSTVSQYSEAASSANGIAPYSLPILGGRILRQWYRAVARLVVRGPLPAPSQEAPTAKSVRYEAPPAALARDSVTPTPEVEAWRQLLSGKDRIVGDESALAGAEKCGEHGPTTGERQPCADRLDPSA